jgi:hypothetical protein
MITCVVMCSYSLATVAFANNPDATVIITPVSKDTAPGLFVGSLAAIQQCAFVLTNNSDKSIVAVSANWTVTDAAGVTSVWRFTSDSFLDVMSRPIALAHSKLLVAPKIWVRKDDINAFVASKVFEAKRMGLERIGRKLASASAIFVEVDAVIFADGEVAGPNRGRFDREIADRKLAANDVLAAVKQAEVDGRPPAEVLLSQFVGKIRNVDDSRALWQRRFARQLSDAEQFDGNRYYLEHLPGVPSFYHK